MENGEERIALAVELFKSGYNCSQAVVAAFADLYGLSREEALKVSASFGGGIGRMRETCGAACGLFILAGLKFGTTVASDSEGKAENYRIVQDWQNNLNNKMDF
jgi:C_GCAxxG_C_C family probable redox protein